ncbi:hypothetical protein ACGFX2_38005 [Streptomyces goshikiensis]|uniref:hypothetical protein n=1 Tax=Streptomyces goshikiensis TaxID=1942 RepID=UPI0037140F49
MTVLKRTSVDWVVCVLMAATAANCKSSIFVVFFTAMALTAAGVGGRKTWRMVMAANSAA